MPPESKQIDARGLVGAAVNKHGKSEQHLVPITRIPEPPRRNSDIKVNDIECI